MINAGSEWVLKSIRANNEVGVLESQSSEPTLYMQHPNSVSCDGFQQSRKILNSPDNPSRYAREEATECQIRWISTQNRSRNRGG